jgi:para-nitrobenzyl esterase
MYASSGGAAHGVEMPFVFDTLGLETERLLRKGPRNRSLPAMHSASVAFAAFGDSGWLKYHPAGRPTMRFDTKLEGRVGSRRGPGFE